MFNYSQSPVIPLNPYLTLEHVLLAKDERFIELQEYCFNKLSRVLSNCAKGFRKFFTFFRL